MGEMRVMGQRGDTKVEWDPENEEEVEAARKHFARLVEKGGRGFRAFAVARAGQRGEPIDEFDPEVGQIILVPPMAGGGSAEMPTVALDRDEAEQIEGVDSLIQQALDGRRIELVAIAVFEPVEIKVEQPPPPPPKIRC